MLNYRHSYFEYRLAEFERAVAEKLGQPDPLGNPFTPNSKLSALRQRLIEEETEEVSEALAGGTKQELAKELADLLYVTIGTCVRYGIPIADVFERVHENNMLKMKNSYIDAGGKLIKPKDHPKVNLSDIVKD